MANHSFHWNRSYTFDRRLTLKHIIVLETSERIPPGMLNYIIANIKMSCEDLYNISIASQSNQPDDDILVIPNATKSGEPRYTAI